MDYGEFLKQKQFNDISAGFEIDGKELIYKGAKKKLKPFQVALVKWGLARGRAALFEDTGLGKTAQQCIWADKVSNHTNKPSLIFAPLAVAKQTIKEAASFGVDVSYIRDMDTVKDESKIYITNYEMQEHFDPAYFSAVVLDESSILKSLTGKIRTEMISRFGTVQYRLSCTATPSPNDVMELGNQSEFLGIMSMAEMLAMFFTHDGSDTQKWILKGHGRKKFWEWLSTWAACIRMPSDIGFSDDGYILPKLNIIEHEIKSTRPLTNQLFIMPAQTLSERRQAKKESIDDRCKLAAQLVNESKDAWIIWCHLNDEQDRLESLITRDCASVRGSDKEKDKESRLLGFADGSRENLLSKPSIAGFGMNYQHAHNMVFTGLDDSFEKFYQAVRREYRFGQEHEVNVHIISSDLEGSVKKNIERKKKQHDEMSIEMIGHMKELMKKHITGAMIDKTEYAPSIKMEIPQWLK